ncbi:MAG: hypothetical protein Q8881_02540 [Sweet potato little leaf phytoplasma]|nr:hypothetical protein [Sweet potato little leaf phytoplasma]
MAEFPLNFTLEDISDEMAEFPSNFTLRDVSPEMAEFPPNFALGVVSDETAEFLPNFALVEVSPERPNFRRLSHSGCFRKNGRMNPDEFTPNSVLGDVSDKTAEFPPNFTLVTFKPKRPNQSRRISAEFRTRGRFH